MQEKTSSIPSLGRSHMPGSRAPQEEKVKVKSLSRVRLFVTPWTVAHQAPLSMGFFRQEYWSGLPFPSPGDIPDPAIKPRSPSLTGGFFTAEPCRQHNGLGAGGAR